MNECDQAVWALANFCHGRSGCLSHTKRTEDPILSISQDTIQLQILPEWNSYSRKGIFGLSKNLCPGLPLPIQHELLLRLAEDGVVTLPLLLNIQLKQINRESHRMSSPEPLSVLWSWPICFWLEDANFVGQWMYHCWSSCCGCIWRARYCC